MSDEGKVLEFEPKTVTAPVVNVPVPSERCVNQGHASRRVAAQLERQRDRLQAKQIYPVFATVLYVFNCDKHVNELHTAHVDLITTPLADLKPDGLDQVLASTEAMLGFLREMKAKLQVEKAP